MTTLNTEDATTLRLGIGPKLQRNVQRLCQNSAIPNTSSTLPFTEVAVQTTGIVIAAETKNLLSFTARKRVLTGTLGELEKLKNEMETI